jgi:hypothetical protein
VRHALVAATLLGALLWQAWPAAGQETCMKAHGQLTLGRAMSDCRSPVNLCLAGTVDGKGFLDGARWRFTATEMAPPGAIDYAGETVIAVRTGTLTTSTRLHVQGEAISIRDRVTAVDVTEPRLMGGRESFGKGAGEFVTTGVGSLEQGIAAEVTGEICLRK